MIGEQVIEIAVAVAARRGIKPVSNQGWREDRGSSDSCRVGTDKGRVCRMITLDTTAGLHVPRPLEYAGCVAGHT